MHVAAYDDVNDCGGGHVAFDCNGADHALFSMVTNAAVVVVNAGYIKGDGAHAIAEQPPAIIGVKGKVFGVVERLSSEGVGHAIDVVPTTVIGEGNRLTGFDGDVCGMKLIVVDSDVMVAVALRHCCKRSKAQCEKGQELTHGLVVNGE